MQDFFKNCVQKFKHTKVPNLYICGGFEMLVGTYSISAKNNGAFRAFSLFFQCNRQ